MAAGKLIIIEGSDGSGKATQTELLCRRLRTDGRSVMAVAFPDYSSESSALVKMYLRGDFGAKADAVNPYAASAFYAVDRVASYERKWKGFLAAGGIVLADRYTTSNMLYQMIKINDPAEKEEYLDWLWEFEFHKLGLPEPDGVILLDVPQDVSERLMAVRTGKPAAKREIFMKKIVIFFANAIPHTVNWLINTAGRKFLVPLTVNCVLPNLFMKMYIDWFQTS